MLLRNSPRAKYVQYEGRGFISIYWPRTRIRILSFGLRCSSRPGNNSKRKTSLKSYPPLHFLNKQTNRTQLPNIIVSEKHRRAHFIQ